MGGRGPSIWDTFTHNYPGKIKDRSNGDNSIDEYHRYKEDIDIMKNMNTDAFRFSISWPRILPKGKVSGGVNKEGIKYYNNLINELLAKGLEPFVTIFHWDLPQALEDEYGGFLSPNIVNDFQDYAEICFKEFGDRVKHWITLNEPWVFAKLGYAEGETAPGRCSAWQNLNCTGGDSAIEPYIVSHHQLLAHAAAVNVYKTKYQVYQKGWIGISLASHWIVPLNDTILDHQASQRALDFMFGCLMYYFIVIAERNGRLIGPKSASDWCVYPKGIRELLLYTKNKYNNPLIYITENGVDEFNDPTLSLEDALRDTPRIDYYYHHLYFLQSAIKDGVNVKGYFAWTLLDNFEWHSGYTVRFGTYFIDYNNDLKRHPKLSAIWFRKFLQHNILTYDA
ncbi:hypothetical protein TanjilG_30986 [Lupinus angustifolius]|uniref:Beta-glucosidase n=1 Tax=Lupinus angustifolius TaxID=3871 RepID=A0A1J7GSY7_LUPAN|nr:hypothetical protein TanjilG_30986 [Lupinus angustifolius]